MTSTFAPSSPPPPHVGFGTSPFHQHNTSPSQTNYDHSVAAHTAARIDRISAFFQDITDGFEQTKGASAKIRDNDKVALIGNIKDDGDFYDLVDRFMDCQEVFRNELKPTQVTVAFHYTKSSNLDSIRRDGLVCSKDVRHGAVYGRGIYVANNPQAFCTYGSMGILVLTLQGEVKQMASSNEESANNDSVDTFLGNKQTLLSGDEQSAQFTLSPYFDEIILREMEQVLPLISFPLEVNNNGDLLYNLQCLVQRVADKWFNNGRTIRVDRIYPSVDDIAAEYKLRRRFSTFHGTTPFLVQTPPHNYIFEAPTPEPMPAVLDACTVSCPSPEDRQKKIVQLQQVKRHYESIYFHNTGGHISCLACSLSLHDDGPHAQLLDCRHLFHPSCLDKILIATTSSGSSPCPFCATPMRSQLVRQPSHRTTVKRVGSSPGGGIMTIAWGAYVQCSGYMPSRGGYIVTYLFRSGIQSALCNHPAPGKPYIGTGLSTYLPHTSDAIELLERLQIIFKRGLLFHVGTLTSGAYGVLSTIPHKTNLVGGASDGYPDASFLERSHDELDRILGDSATSGA